MKTRECFNSVVEVSMTQIIGYSEVKFLRTHIINNKIYRFEFEIQIMLKKFFFQIVSIFKPLRNKWRRNRVEVDIKYQLSWLKYLTWLKLCYLSLHFHLSSKETLAYYHFMCEYFENISDSRHQKLRFFQKDLRQAFLKGDS